MGNGSGGNYMLDGRLISGATPSDGNVLTWVTADRCWEPRPASSILPLVVNQDYYIDGVSGLDTNDGLTKTTPLATLQGFFTKYGYEVPVGSERRVHLAGTGGSDPWVTPTGQQTYSIDEINVGTNGPVGNRTVFRGPQNLIRGVPATGPATAALDALPGGCAICYETDVANPAGQRTRLNFVGAAPGWTAHDFSVYGQGYKLRITRAGAKVIFECPIADNGANFIIVDTLGLVGVVLATDTFEIVYPAANIRGATNYGGGARMGTITGTGANIVSMAAPTATSMAHNFERLVFTGMLLIKGSNITFDRCCFTPGVGSTVCPSVDGSCYFVNSMAVQVITLFRNGGRHLTDGVVNSAPRPDGAADPINQLITVGFMTNQLRIESGSQYFATRNTSCYGSAANGMLVDRQSYFEQTATCAYLGGNANTAFGISASDGGIVKVLAGTAAVTGMATQIIGTTDAFQVDGHVGVGYGPGAGDFGDAASYNGNYHNTDLAAWTGHMSNIHT